MGAELDIPDNFANLDTTCLMYEQHLMEVPTRGLLLL